MGLGLRVCMHHTGLGGFNDHGHGWLALYVCIFVCMHHTGINRVSI